MVAVNIQSERGHEKLQVSFGKQAEIHLRHYAEIPERELFYYLINVDEFSSVGPRAQQLVTEYLEKAQATLASPETAPPRLQAFTYTPAAFAERMEALYRHQVAAPPPLDAPLTAEQLHYVLKQYAPSALIDGCWLQNISLAPTNHTEVATRLFHLYAEKIGDGDASKHYGNLYQDLLRSARIYLPEVNTRRFITRKDMGDDAFTRPVFQLALSLFPRVCLPELIGFTLGHFSHPQDRLLVALSDEIKRRGLDDRYCQHYALPDQPGRDARLIHEVVTLHLDGFRDEAERQQHWQRIWNGLVTHTVISERWLRDLHDAMRKPRTLTSPHQKMMAMVREKALHARNMHRNRKLGGQLINDWFAQKPFDAEGFLKALAASPYVSLKAPLESALLTRSIRFGGPMFRIFTDAEQAVIAEWVQSLASEPQPDELADIAVDMPPVSRSALAPVQQDDTPDLATYAKCSKRELYYYFVNADLYPDALPTARKVARQYFKRAKAEMGKRGLPAQQRLFPYSHDALESRIRLIYETETNAYETFVPPSTVPREIMIWFMQQYAPFPMVDGSWVQHIAKAGVSQTEISARLFRIYSDEVGNADTFLNHPNVFRRLLEGEGIHMPPTDSLEFAMQPALRDFAFDLPLLTLSVSMFPKAFLPEIIGVNLAIELSGLGKDYMQTIDELRYWKIDPSFFTLHLTIDNIASGHTAVAMETVHLYLDQILATQGQQAMQREWERIWIGYLAFKHSMTRFDSTLEWKGSLLFLIPLIRLKIRRGKEKKRVSTAKAA
ncbi:MAG: iron-containing redox enzyme family protein [Gammaproteobacteria bacterium]|nr:iron-containing redox enzyme family protein [Gammaproteobacteria bacterium]